MKADHLQNGQKINVSGHLEDIRGIYHMKLSWVDQAGKRGRRSVSTKLPVKGNKKRAEEQLRQTIKEQKEKLLQIPAATNLLFADFMEQWLESINPNAHPNARKKIKLTTYGGYCFNVKSNIVPYFRAEGTLLSELTADDVNEFYDIQLDRVKGATVQKYHGNISKALKYAVKNGLIPHSIMDKVERPRAERYVGTFLKQSEAVALFDAVKGHKLELGVMIGAFYGLRRGEIVGLRWSAIDFEANTITIEHTVTMANIDGKSVIVADDTVKTKSSLRTLPLVPAFRTMLMEIRKTQRKNKDLCGRSWNKTGNEYIYTDPLGNRIHPNYLSKEFPVFLKKHSFRKMRFHDLRHSCASLLLANGVPLKQIQEWLGHSTFSITADTYAHLEYNSKLSAAQAMSWIDKTSFGQLLGPEPATT